MKVKAGLRIGMLAALFGAAGCYPRPCSPNDLTCLPCTDARTQNPACAPPWQPVPIDQKNPDGGSR